MNTKHQFSTSLILVKKNIYMKIILKVVFLTLLFIVPNIINAQISISGKVTDQSSGEALIGANIFLKSDLSKGTVTDLDGQFELDIASLADTLLISYLGYEALEFNLHNIKNTKIEIQLIPAAAAMKEVVIKAKKIIAKEFIVQEISKLEVYLNPSAKADALLAVQSLPYASSPDETANISLRGSPASETGIFLNGVPMHDAVRLDQTNGVGQFSIFNTQMIKSVQVFPSNPPLELGAATSGAVVLNTEDKIMDKATSINLTMVGAGAFLSRKLGKKTSLAAYTNLTTHRMIKKINPVAFEQIKSFHGEDIGAYLIHQLSKKSVLKVFNFTLLEGYEYQGEEESLFQSFTQKKDRNISVANYYYQWDNAKLEFNQGFNISKAHYGVGNINHNIKNVDYFGALNIHYFKEKWSLKSGLSFNYHQIDAHGTLPIYDHAYGTQHPSFEYDTIASVNLPELFLYAKYHLTKKITLGLGTRNFLGNKELDSYWNNQINLNYQLTDEHRLTFSIGNYNKYLLPGAETQEVRLKSSFQYALDYEYKKEGWKINIAAYRKQTNFGEIKNPIYGAEVYLSSQQGAFKWNASLAHIRSKIEIAEISYPSSFDFGYFVRANARYDLLGWIEINLAYQLREGKYFVPVIGSRFHELTQTYIPQYANIEAGTRLPSYQKLDIGFSKILVAGEGSVILFLNLNNIFDNKNISHYNYNLDYSKQLPSYYNRRVLFVGGVWNW